VYFLPFSFCSFAPSPARVSISDFDANGGTSLFLFFYVSHKKVVFRTPCRLGDIETPFNFATNFSTVHTRKRNNLCRRASITEMLFSIFSFYSRYSPDNHGGKDEEQIYIYVVILGLSHGQHCYISTLRDVFASQLFALLRLVHKHPLRNDSIVFDQKTHKTKQKISLSWPMPLRPKVSRRIVRHQTEKKEIRPFHASFRHSVARFIPVVSPNTGP